MPDSNSPAADAALNETRLEHDLIGGLEISNAAFYGIQTHRAVHNFQLSNTVLSDYPALIKALAIVKHAAADANHALGLLEPKRHQAIVYACERIVAGNHIDQFPVDMIQGGAGTSTNMNMNEVVANIGLEYLGHAKGEYAYLHPNNDVNMSQSTNDAYPTAIRLGLLMDQQQLVSSLNRLIQALAHKGSELAGVIKMGRTQLQDAVPMTLGQEFQAFASTLASDAGYLQNEAPELLYEINLGGTAIGTGINAHPDYARVAVERLATISGHPVRLAPDLIAATSDMGSFVMLSAAFKRLALHLSKLSNDLRLLASGPRTGLHELNLPARQPGSSIMPGKVNPVIPEAMNQVAFTVAGNDLAITMAAEAGQLQLNVMEPLIVFKLFESSRLLTRAMDMLRTHCIEGITANEAHCRHLVEHSIALVTALNPLIGYENSTRIAALASATGCGVIELVREENLLDEVMLNTLLSPDNMVRPSLASPPEAARN